MMVVHAPNPAHRGFALLLTLVAVVLIMAALGGLITALQGARLQTATTDDRDRLVDLLGCGEQLALEWATKHSATAVFPPAGGRVALLHDVMTTQDGDAEVQIDLYDGCAGVPIAGPSLRSPLQLALSGPWQSLAAIDGMTETDALERLEVPDGLRRFPTPSATPPVAWGDGTWATTPPTAIASGGPASLAEVVSPSSAGRININTAPEPLLRLVFQELQIGGIDDVLARREKGQAVEAPPTPASAAISLVSASPVWQAVIATRWRTASRSWWVVLTVGNQGKWTILQRHDADR